MGMDKLLVKEELDYYKENRDFIIEHYFEIQEFKAKMDDIDITSVDDLKLFIELCLYKSIIDTENLIDDKDILSHISHVLQLILGIKHNTKCPLLKDIIVNLNGSLYGTNQVIRGLKKQTIKDVEDLNLDVQELLKAYNRE